MNAVPFDTLKLARRLEGAGITIPMAAATAEALADIVLASDLATKTDLGSVEKALRADITAVEKSLRADISGVEKSLRADIAALRQDLEAKIQLLARDMVIRMGGMFVVGIGILIAVIRYLPHHP